MSGFEKLLVGQTLGRWYRIDGVLGNGGFGVVFRATDLRPERAAPTVAVKVLALPPGLDADGVARMRGRFRQEAAFAAALPHHPNVVPISDYGSDGGFDFLVMALLRGEDLRARLGRPEPLALPLALRILRDAARGVAVGHQAGLIHRDVKPGNVFLEEGGPVAPVVRVLDFGIAKRVEGGDEQTDVQLTRHGEGVFSRFYASPEQLRREGGLSRASDVFSLGVVGFELLTRTRPWDEAAQARRDSGLPVAPPLPTARNPELPVQVEEVLLRALAHSPRERYRDAAVFEEALRGACRAAGLRLDAGHRVRGAAGAVPGPAEAEGPRGPAGSRTASAADAGDTVVVRPAGETRTADAAGETVFAGAEVAGEETAFAGAAAADGDSHGSPSGGRRDGDGPAAGEGDDAGWLPMEERRAAGPHVPRWRRAGAISRRQGMAIAAAVVLLLGSAVVMSAAAVGTGAALLDRLFGGPVVEDAPRERPARLSAADANRAGLRAFGRRDYAEALESFAQAHRRAPRVAEYHNNYAWALFKSGQPERASRELERLLRRHPDRWLARENLAAAHLAAGDTAAAAEALRGLLAHEPPADRRRDAERLLARLQRPAGMGEFVETHVTVLSTAHDAASPVPGPPAEVRTETPAAPVTEAPPPPIRVDTAAASLAAAEARPGDAAGATARDSGVRAPARRGGPRDTVRLRARRDTVRLAAP